ncbi:MAG: hypothetical protein U1F46_03105 [Marinagarivorans sp.]
MKPLNTLISLLDKPDDEIWGNVWSDDAFELLRKEHAFLFPIIIQEWKLWPENRQEHLAFLLGSTGTPDEKALIVAMLGATYSSVRKRAKEALEEFEMCSTKLP